MRNSKTLFIITPIISVICICMIAACGSEPAPPTGFDCSLCPTHSTCDSVGYVCNCDSGYVAFSDSANGIYFACQEENTFNCSTCPANSTCDPVNQICNCNTGYEQTVDSASGIMTCQEPRSKFLGLYVGGSTCTAAADSITITASNSDITEVSINRLTTPSTSVGPVIATVNGTSITIASQTVLSGHTVSGSGTLTTSSLSLQYTVMSAGGNSSCDFSGTKQ